MKKFMFSIFVLFLFSLSALSGQVSAQTTVLKYPIADLGFCRDAKECYLYCEIPQNKAACWSYGKFKLGVDVLGVTTEEEQVMQEKARKLGITFPITELGNCTSPTECRNYCEQPSNQTACMNFAKKTGLEKPPNDGMEPAKRAEILEKARTELGCTTMESCKATCDSNPTKCQAFAQRYGLQHEPPPSQEQRQLLENARAELGCTSQESCKATCEQNPQRCMEFAKKHGMEQPQERREERRDMQGQPGQMQPPQGMPSQPNQAGPSGYGPADCRTQSECENYCKNNPSRCPGFSEKQQMPQISPVPQQYQQTPTNYLQPPTGSTPPPDGSYQPPTTTSGGTTEGTTSTPPPIQP